MGNSKALTITDEAISCSNGQNKVANGGHGISKYAARTWKECFVWQGKECVHNNKMRPMQPICIRKTVYNCGTDDKEDCNP
jgi:hypothetical protein